jgi:hypothetical protein
MNTRNAREKELPHQNGDEELSYQSNGSTVKYVLKTKSVIGYPQWDFPLFSCLF